MIDHDNIDNIWNSGCGKILRNFARDQTLFVVVLLPNRSTTKTQSLIFSKWSWFVTIMVECNTIIHMAIYSSFGNNLIRAIFGVRATLRMHSWFTLPQTCSLLVRDHLYRFWTQSGFSMQNYCSPNIVHNCNTLPEAINIKINRLIVELRWLKHGK